nr:sensor domain-containing diguanylate cyclase [Nocardia bovistercoris]
MARRWWQALASGHAAPLSARLGQRLLLRFIDDLVAALGAERCDPSRAWRVGAALVDARLSDPAVPLSSARVLRSLVDRDSREDAEERLAVLLAALAQGHQARLCGAHDRGEPPSEVTESGGADGLYRHLFDNAPLAIAIADTDGRLVEVNRNLADMLGIPADDLRGASVYQFAPPDDHELIRARVFEEMVSAKEGTVLIDRQLTRPDGEVIWVSFTVTFVQGSGPYPDYTLAVGSDDTARRRTQEQLRHQARHDPLTGLPNRRYLLERMGRLIRDAGDGDDRIGLCFADLDHFKRINDRFGHGVGDKILTAIAARLRDIAREHDCLIARIGGDEFVALIPPPADLDLVRKIADLLLSQITAPIDLDTRQQRISASIGAVLAPIADAESVLEAADSSLYRAKATDKGRYVIRDLHGHPPEDDATTCP